MIDCVTITGADDSVDPDVLFVLAAEYPFVEFGILLSAGQLATRRFPSHDWVREVVRRTDAGDALKLSGHICGQWLRDAYMGRWPARLAYLDGKFQRWQLNTHGMKTLSDPDRLNQLISALNLRGQQVIFQFDEVNVDPLLIAARLAYNVAALFDLSHGAGVLPETWPQPLNGIRCGYAGGLSPDNVTAQLEAIAAVVPENRRIWIDVETKVRSDDDRQFDVTLVRRFLDAAKPWIA